MLAKLLVGQETLATRAIGDRSTRAHLEWFQTLQAKLEEVILEVQSVELIIQAANGFNNMLDELVEENKAL